MGRVRLKQKKTARPVSRSRRFARTFVERSSHSPRGAAGHNSFTEPRVAGELRDPRPLPPSSGHVRSMRMDRSHRTPAPVSRRILPSRGGAVLRRRRFRRGTPEAHQRLSPPRETLRSLSPSGFRSSRSPNFVRRTFCLHTRSDKHGIPPVPVSQWDNGDGFPGHTTEGGAREPNALNPAPR